MAFETKNFYVARKHGLAKSEFTVECNVMAGMNVSKVLSVSLGCSRGASEVLNGIINYSGVVDTKVVFIGEDGQLNTISSMCPFSSKFESEDIENGQVAIINLKIIDHNIESVNGEAIKISVILEQSGCIIANKEVHSIKNDDDDMCCKDEDISIIKFIGNKSENVEVSSEFNVRDKVSKIVLTESNVIVKSVESGMNFATISGEVSTKIVYITDNEKFESGYVYDSFKEELELEGVTRESLVDGNAKVIQENVAVELVEDEKGCKIVIKVPLALSISAYGEENISVVKDLYSIKSELKVTTESFNMTCICPMETIDGKIEGSLSLDENQPRVDKILFNCGNSVTITNSYLKDGEIFIEGIAKTTVVYLNDESNSLYSAQIDVPFTISDKFEHQEGGMIMVDAAVYDADVVVKKGRELLYDAKVKACVNYCFDRVSGIITEASVLEDYQPKDYAMEVVFAHAGEDTWEIAKNARVKEEQLIAQNADVVFPLENDASLILFYQKV